MKIIAVEHEIPGVKGVDFSDELLKAEARRVWELQRGDFLREIYFRTDRDEAVLILECADVETARKRLATLPLVEAGLIEFELIPLRPYPGLERLFR